MLALAAAVALGRAIAPSSSELLVELAALNAVAFVPVWPVLLLGVATRRLALAGAGAALVVAQVAYAAPEVLAARPVPRWASAAPHIRLLDANVGADGGRTDVAGFARQIRSVSPDVVLLEEATPGQVATLVGDGALAALRFRYEVRGLAPWGFAVASRFRLRVVGTSWRGGEPYLVRLVLSLPGGPLRLWMVHAASPALSVADWRTELTGVAGLVRSLGSGRLVIAGDFNASWGNPPFAGIVARGLADAAAARGDPFAMTWPEGLVVPPLVRIDHVLVGPGLSVPAISTGNGPGSDHRDLVATLAVAPRPLSVR